MARLIAKFSVTEPGEYELHLVDSAPVATPPVIIPPAPPAPPAQAWTSIPFAKRVAFPKGRTGPSANGATVLGIPAATRYRIKYDVMPEGAFDFRAGGKLPGLGGGNTPAGGSKATDGFTARLMWNQGGRLSFYFYRVTGGAGGIDTGGYGTHWRWALDALLKPGQWNTIELLCDVVTGETVGYLNGVEKARQSLKYLWPTIDKHVFSCFFGGQGVQYEPAKDESMIFRDMKILPGG